MLFRPSLSHRQMHRKYKIDVHNERYVNNYFSNLIIEESQSLRYFQRLLLAMEITKSANMELVRNVVMNHIVIGMKNVTIIDVLLSGDQAMMDIEIQAVTLDSYVLLEDIEV